MNLPRRLFARFANGRHFFERVIVTGSHAASAEHVADRRAAAASIDCVTYAFLAETDPALIARLRIIARTDWSPAIPFVTIDDGDLSRIDALRGALRRLANEPRFAPALRALHIGGILGLGERNYTMLATYEHDARAARYPVLC
jgi:ABC-type phosphate/phosphonate transport system substrate-binding protein